MKLFVFILMMLVLSACADMSMYNQVPAPLGRSGETTQHPSSPPTESVITYAIDDDQIQGDVEQPYSNPNSNKNDLTSQNPAIVALLDSAYQQSESGQLDIAASKLERAVRIAPRDPAVWHALAKIRYQQNKYALSISLAKKSNLLSGGNIKLQRNNWLLMAACYDRLGNERSASQARASANRLF